MSELSSTEDWIICFALIRYKLKNSKRLPKKLIPKIATLKLNRDTSLCTDVLQQYKKILKLDDEKSTNIKIFCNLIWLAGSSYEKDLSKSLFLMDHCEILQDLILDIDQRTLQLHYYKSYKFLLVNLVPRLAVTKFSIEDETVLILYRCYQLILISNFVLKMKYKSTTIIPIKKYLTDQLLLKFSIEEYAAFYFKSSTMLSISMSQKIHLTRDLDADTLLTLHFESVKFIINNLIERCLTSSRARRCNITVTELYTLMKHLLLLLQNLVELIIPEEVKESNKAYSQIYFANCKLRNSNPYHEYMTRLKSQTQLTNGDIKLFINKIIEHLLSLYARLNFRKVTSVFPMSNFLKKIIHERRTMIQSMLLVTGKTKMLVQFRSIDWVN